MENQSSRIKWAAVVITATLVMLSIGCSAATTKLSKDDQVKVIFVCKQFLEALRQDKKPTIVSLLDKRSNILHRIKKIEDTYPVIERVRGQLGLANKTAPISSKSLVLSTKCPQNVVDECIDRAFFWNDTQKKQSWLPVLVEYAYRKDQPPAVITVVKTDGKWRIADLPEWNTKIYKIRSLYDVILANRTTLMSYQLDSHLVQASSGDELPKTTIPKQEQTSIIAECTKYLEALRKGDKATLIALIAPATEYYQQIQVDTAHLDTDPSSSIYSNDILPGDYQFPNIDTCRARLGLNSQKTPISSSSLTFSTGCPWTVMKDVINTSYASQMAPPKLISPSTVAMVEFRYLKDHNPVVVPIVKVGNRWLVACVPIYNTKIYKLKSFYDLADMFKNNVSEFLSYTFDCVDAEPTRYVFSTQEQAEITSVCQQFMDALRLGQKQQLVSLTDGDTAYGRIIRSEGKRYDSLISSWVRTLGLSTSESPAKDRTLTISTKCPWSMMKDIINTQFAGAMPTGVINLSTITLVELSIRQDRPPLLIPVAKVNGKWLVMGMPDLDINAYNYKRLNDYWTSGM